MAFESLSAFIAMEGHGPYVWTCYAVFFLCLAGMMIQSLRRRRTLMENYRRALSQQQSAQEGTGTAASFTRVDITQN